MGEFGGDFGGEVEGGGPVLGGDSDCGVAQAVVAGGGLAGVLGSSSFEMMTDG